MPSKMLAGSPGSEPKTKKLNISDKKADSALVGLQQAAQKKHWDDDINYVLEAMKHDRDLCLSLVGSATRWQKRKNVLSNSTELYKDWPFGHPIIQALPQQQSSLQ